MQRGGDAPPAAAATLAAAELHGYNSAQTNCGRIAIARLKSACAPATRVAAAETRTPGRGRGRISFFSSKIASFWNHLFFIEFRYRAPRAHALLPVRFFLQQRRQLLLQLSVVQQGLRACAGCHKNTGRKGLDEYKNTGRKGAGTYSDAAALCQ